MITPKGFRNWQRDDDGWVGVHGHVDCEGDSPLCKAACRIPGRPTGEGLWLDMDTYEHHLRINCPCAYKVTIDTDAC